MSLTQPETAPHGFARSRMTWLLYLMPGFLGYLSAALGTLLPFLRSDLHISYTIGGLHLSMVALGNVLVGLTGRRLFARWSRHHLFWWGNVGMVGGSLLLLTGQHTLQTLLATLVMGTMGACMLVTAQAVLADYPNHQRSLVLTESHTMIILCSSLAPAMISLSVALGWGWRGAVFGGCVVWFLVSWWNRLLTIPEPTAPDHTTPTPTHRALPHGMRRYWGLIFLSVAVEWCITFWGASYLSTVRGFAPTIAAGTMSIFFVGMIAGRVAMSRLVSSSPIPHLLLVSEGVILLALLSLGLVSSFLITIVGAFTLGLGVAGLYPLTLAAAMSAASQHATAISLRVTLSTGLSMLMMPTVLGWLADQVGLQIAFGIEPVLLIGIVGLTWKLTDTAGRAG